MRASKGNGFKKKLQVKRAKSSGLANINDCGSGMFVHVTTYFILFALAFPIVSTC